MKPRRALAPMAILATVICTPLQAQNLRFLDYSPSTYFTDKDWELLRGAVNDALANKKPGETVEWSNQSSGSHGTVTPLDSFEQFNTTCRRVRVSNEAHDIKATRVLGLCKDPGSGEWKIAN